MPTTANACSPRVCRRPELPPASMRHRAARPHDAQPRARIRASACIRGKASVSRTCTGATPPFGAADRFHTETTLLESGWEAPSAWSPDVRPVQPHGSARHCLHCPNLSHVTALPPSAAAWVWRNGPTALDADELPIAIGPTRDDADRLAAELRYLQMAAQRRRHPGLRLRRRHPHLGWPRLSGSARKLAALGPSTKATRRWSCFLPAACSPVLPPKPSTTRTSLEIGTIIEPTDLAAPWSIWYLKAPLEEHGTVAHHGSVVDVRPADRPIRCASGFRR